MNEVSHYPNLGAVIIGRNEAANLVQCIASLRECASVVYVDSGSTDGSVALASKHGATVVELTMDDPFTAARARNAGFRRLCSLNPNLVSVQFVDGDCEVISGWIPKALDVLNQNAELAVVCGRRMERHPNASIYNRLCDREWDTPAGETNACGGDAMIKANAFHEVGGFADSQIAHEEPELCYRLRTAGWKIRRINCPMTFHDANIKRLRQFYNRCRRAGFGISQCLARLGYCADPNGRAIIQRALLWSLVLPIAILSLLILFGAWGALGALILPMQIIRHAMQDRQRVGGSIQQRLVASSLFLLEKFATAHGCIEFLVRHNLSLRQKPILYK